MSHGENNTPLFCPPVSAASRLFLSAGQLRSTRAHTRARYYGNFDFAVTRCTAPPDWSTRSKRRHNDGGSRAIG